MEVRIISKPLLLAFCAVSALITAACHTPTPADRIAENPALYDKVPVRHRELVQNGQICRGMSPDAVFLAWGKPNSAPIEGERDGKRVVRWVYKRYEPHMVTTDWWGAPYMGVHGWHEPFYPTTGTVYVPTDSAFVEFMNGKVVSWERKR